MTHKLASVLPVWLIAVVGAVLVAVFSVPTEYFTWLAIVFAGSVLATFGIQLFLQQSEGFVARAMSSIVGALVVLAIATGILSLVS